MTLSSRLPGFYKLEIPRRHGALSDAVGVDANRIASDLQNGGLEATTADKFVENVLGTYALPYAIALNVRVDQHDYVVPMVVEEPSVVAAASNAAKMVRAGGGFAADIDPPLMISQIQLLDISDLDAAVEALSSPSARTEILALANSLVPGLVSKGGGAREAHIRVLSPTMLVVHLIVDCCDAMGANLVNTIAEGVAPRLAQLANGARVGLRILSNLADRRCVRVRCCVPVRELATDQMSGLDVAHGIESASRFAEIDPYRAATHNKGIMNGVDAVVLATGNDWRAVEAGAHAFAARSGRYMPLATWRVVAAADDGGDEQVLVGQLELPMALGTVGGTLRVHRGARLSLEILGVSSASALGAVVASVGLASNLAALRALASDGIQRGHMALHARSVALAANTPSDLVDQVAAMIVEDRDISIAGATRALLLLATARQ